MKSEKSCGGIIFKKEKGQIQYLCIKNKSGGHWDFPKGHVEGKETEEETARREIHEEVGLTVHFIDGFRESISYVDTIHNVDKTVVFFLCEAISTDIKYIFDEVEDHKWLSFNEAIVQLTYGNSKDLLRKAEAFVKKPVQNKEKYQKIAVGGLLIHDEKVLVVRRSAAEQFLTGYYELPGGKVDFGQHPEEGIIREFKEEVNLAVVPKKILRIFSYISHNDCRHTVEIVYVVELTDDLKKLALSEEHDDFKWVSLSDVKSLQMSDEIKESIKIGLQKF